MPEERIVISSEPTLSPDEIASHSFPVAFRGFEQAEVRRFLKRLGDELAAVRERERDMRRSLEEARQRLAHPEIDEVTLTAALGEETGRILRSAREAASDVRAKAESHAARIIQEAEEQAQRQRGEAENVLARRVEEADEVAANIRQAAEADARTVRDQVQSELESARARGREMVAEAQAVRERVLNDLARRRRGVQSQVEQLLAGRDRLLDAYRTVRRSLDEVTAELSGAEQAAREAADAAARRAPSFSEAVAADADGAEPAVPDQQLAPEPAPPDAEEPEPTPAPAPVPEEAPVPAPAPAATRAPAAPAPDRPLPPEPEPVTPRPSLVQLQPANEDERVRVIRPEPSPPAPPRPEPEPVPPPAPAVAFEPAPPGEMQPEVEAQWASPPEPAAVPNGEPDGGSVEDLFARLRAEREEAVTQAQEVLRQVASQPALEPERVGGGEEVPSEEPEPDGDGDAEMLRRRDEAVEKIEVNLARKLKRALQDEQNELLDRLRRTRVRAEVEAVLPAPDDQAGRYRGAAAPALEQAAAAGAAFLGANGGPEEKRMWPVTEWADELATEIASGLRERLTRSPVPDSADEADVAESLGAVYRQWKTERIDDIARHHVAAAFSRGVFIAAPFGSALRWVFGDAGPCPDCDDNALAGPTAKGEAYPTGQLHPPAHAGCRCLLTVAPA